MALSKQQQEMAISMWENHQCDAKTIGETIGVSPQDIHTLLGARCCTYMANLTPPPEAIAEEDFSDASIVPDIVFRQVKAQLFATALAPAAYTDKWIKHRALEKLMDMAVNERKPKVGFVNGEGQVSVHIENNNTTNNVSGFAAAIAAANTKTEQRFKELKAKHSVPSISDHRVMAQIAEHVDETKETPVEDIIDAR